MIALYAGLLLFFPADLQRFGSDTEKGNLLCSQILSIGLLNLITYIQISLLDKNFMIPGYCLMTVVQL